LFVGDLSTVNTLLKSSLCFLQVIEPDLLYANYNALTTLLSG